MTDTTTFTMGSKADIAVNCSQCQKEISSKNRTTFKGAAGEDLYLCDSCMAKANQAFDEETKNPNFPVALLCGLGASALGIAIWSGIAIVTGYEIGYIGIGIGFLIAKAIWFGAGKKYGFPLQIMSVALTLFTLIAASLYLYLYFSVQGIYSEYQMKMSEMELVNQILANPEMMQAFLSDFSSTLLSPIGLFIWAISLYYSFKQLQPRKL